MILRLRSSPLPIASAPLASRLLSVLVLTALVGCVGPSVTESPVERPENTPQQSRSLVLAIRYEPTDLASKMIAQGSTTGTKRPFNASLALIDSAGQPRTYLAERLPALNTDTWRVFPDGRMETIHTLRPGLAWHDGAPLNAEDFVFAWRLYTAPDLGTFTPQPQDIIESVVALDPLRVLMQWRSPYADASALTEDGFEPMPRHLLEEPLAAFELDPTLGRAAFLGLPFWTAQHVGAGPYKLKHWEPGAYLEGEAFEGHVLGRPRVDRVIFRLITDENATLTNLMAGEIDVATRLALRLEHALVLKREWVPSKRGAVILSLSNSGQYAMFQFRPEFLKAPELMNRQVRQAFVHAFDRAEVNDALFEGAAPLIETFLSPQVPYYAQIERSIVKYPYDPRRTDQLMNEAGLAKDAEGFYANTMGGRFRPEFQALAGTLFERAQAIIVDTWWRAGIQVQPVVLPATLVRDNEARHSFAGISSAGGVLGALRNFLSVQIGSRANRWVGQNRGGWSHAAYDRLWDEYSRTLDPSERQRQLAQVVKLISEEVPGFPLYANVDVWAHAAPVSGLQPGTMDTTPFWNIHAWQLR